jgi:dipeptidase E
MERMKKLLIVSTSTIHGKPYLEYLFDEIKDFFSGVSSIVFIPYARPSGMTYDEYTLAAHEKFEMIGIQVKGIHEYGNPVDAINQAQGVFTGGGNSFLLLHELLERNLIEPLRKRIEDGMPYMGTSAGSNITGPTIGTTNDMPIVYPATFDGLQVIPFNINPHYLDPDPNSTHKGETRQTRIEEFLIQNDIKVVGLREGSWLRFENGSVELKGDLHARIFIRGKEPYEYPPNKGDFRI